MPPIATASREVAMNPLNSNHAPTGDIAIADDQAADDLRIRAIAVMALVVAIPGSGLWLADITRFLAYAV